MRETLKVGVASRGKGRQAFVLAFLALAGGALAQSSPVVLPAVRGYGLWVVTASVGGKEGQFVVGLQASETVVRAEWLGDAGTEVTIAGRRVGTAKKSPGFLPNVKSLGRPVAGSLGIDVLGRYAVGFDPVASTVTLWEGAPADEPGRWVGEGSSRLPLESLKDGIPALRARLRSASVLLTLTSTGEEVILRKGLEAPADVEFPGHELLDGASGEQSMVVPRATDALAIPGWRLPWVRYRLAPAVDYEGADGAFPINLATHGRVLVDLPRRALFVRDEAPDVVFARELSSLLRFPVRLEGDRVVIGEIREERLAALKPFEGHELLELAHMPMADVVKGLRGERRLELLRKFEDMRRVVFEAVVRGEGDVEQRFRLEPNPTG